VGTYRVLEANHALLGDERIYGGATDVVVVLTIRTERCHTSAELLRNNAVFIAWCGSGVGWIQDMELGRTDAHYGA
jgi:hypothetical protein